MCRDHQLILTWMISRKQHLINLYYMKKIHISLKKHETNDDYV